MDREDAEAEEGTNAFAGTSSPPPFRKSSARRVVPRSPDQFRRNSGSFDSSSVGNDAPPALLSSSAAAAAAAAAVGAGTRPVAFAHGALSEYVLDSDLLGRETGEEDRFEDYGAASAAETDDGAEVAAGPRKETVGRGVPVPRPAGEVSLVVGGRRFVCQVCVFQQHPNTMLGRMFGSSLEMSRPNDNGDYVITHSVTSAAFHAILNFYKSGQIRCPPNVSVAELHEACNFFMIPFTHTSVKCENLGHLLQQLSNQGARCQFEEFIEESILPAMARSAQMGDRECHIVCLSDDDTVEWDDDLPPRQGEQWAQIIHSIRLFRFMKDHENRLIAKQMLKEKGLKNIRVGIEGFPTYVDKIRTGSNGDKIEVEYNYEQRPFVRVSWAVEESKSRHVDFQCVRLRTASASAHSVLA